MVEGYGEKAYPKTNRLLITADAGGSNGYRVRLWKVELQKLANEVNTPPPKGGGFRLRLKAGLVRLRRTWRQLR